MAVAEGMVRVSAANRDGNNSAFFDLTDGRFLSETQATKYDLIRKGVFLDGKYYKPNLVYDVTVHEDHVGRGD
jgi:hypothetical protein